MKTTSLAIADAVLLEPKILRNERGLFFESFNHAQSTNYSPKKSARCIAWNAPTQAIQWPAMASAPKLSFKDAAGSRFVDARSLL